MLNGLDNMRVCHHTASIKPLPKNPKLVCNTCGSHVARVVRVLKQNYVEWRGDASGTG